MYVRCKKGHIWDLKLEWEDIERGEIPKKSDIKCPFCHNMPFAEVKVAEARLMGDLLEGRKITRIR